MSYEKNHEHDLCSATDSSSKEIILHIRQDGKGVNICVSDSGPGIPKSAIKKVFDDFYRVDCELTRTTRGTGIGLSLVKQFITALGGTVSAANNPSDGCAITISLPVKETTADGKN